MSQKRKYNKASVKTWVEKDLFKSVQNIINKTAETQNAEWFIDTRDGSVFFANVDERKIILHFIMPSEIGMFGRKRPRDA